MWYSWRVTAWVSTCDQFGHETSRRLLDADGLPAPDRDGCAVVRWRYDDVGDIVGRDCLDAGGEPVTAP